MWVNYVFLYLLDLYVLNGLFFKAQSDSNLQLHSLMKSSPKYFYIFMNIFFLVFMFY